MGEDTKQSELLCRLRKRERGDKKTTEKMSHQKFAPKLVELKTLVCSNACTKEISSFLDKDGEFIQYLRENDEFDQKDFWETGFDLPPLHRAALHGRADILKLYLAGYGFCVDARYTFRLVSMTALQAAIWHNKPDCVRVMLEHGADPGLGGKCNGIEFKSALGFAEIPGGSEEIRTLLKQSPSKL